MNKKIKGGIDAPLVPLSYLVVGFLSLLIYFYNRPYPFAWMTVVYGLAMIGGGIIFLHTSLRGKYLIWDKIIASLTIPQNAHILDLGCGHGAVLIKFAQKINKPGRVVGVNLWHSSDQSHNSENETKENLALLGLTNKTELLTADMSDLPLTDHSFDFVVSSLAFHNIKPQQKREQALREACRVLKTGGKLVIVDTGNNLKEYCRILKEEHFTDIYTAQAGFNGWWTGPWMRTSIIQAKKSADATV